MVNNSFSVDWITTCCTHVKRVCDFCEWVLPSTATATRNGGPVSFGGVHTGAQSRLPFRKELLDMPFDADRTLS